MRQEIREYNHDWKLYKLFGAASSSRSGTEKEYRNMLNYIPSFRNVVEPIFSHEEVGVAFLKMVHTYLGNILNAREQGKKVAGTTFCFSPAILFAMDIVPITFELITVMGTFLKENGTAEFLDYCCEIGFTETSCSSQRGTLGAYLSGLGAEIDFFINDSPGVCDTNANAFAFAAAYLDKPFYQLNMPSDLTGERSMKYHREDFKNMILFLEEQTGKKLEPEKLKEILEEIQVQDEICDEIEEYQVLKPNPAPPTFPVFLYATRFLFSGMKEGTTVLRKMRDSLKGNVEKGISGLHPKKEKIRALFCYIDHYTTNLRFWEMLSDNGITHLGNILSRQWDSDSPIGGMKENKDQSYTINTRDLDSMIDSIAMINSRMPMIKSIRGPYDKPHMWLHDTLTLAKLYDADMIVYNGTPGCRNTWGMVKMFARDTEKQGYPTYIMYADAFDDRVESWEMTRTRFEEFLKVRRLV
ncbi:MAG: 2-hydroxyacyl-CoA dehydratase [bacterium]|nr:2-hydroxyacyl-CoA dehydratase [bacterium]